MKRSEAQSFNRRVNIYIYNMYVHSCKISIIVDVGATAVFNYRTISKSGDFAIIIWLYNFMVVQRERESARTPDRWLNTFSH